MDDPPIYLHGRPVPTLTTEHTPCSVLVGVVRTAERVERLASVCSVRVCACGTCRVNKAAFSQAVGSIDLVTGKNYVVADCLCVCVLVDDLTTLLVNVTPHVDFNTNNTP